MVLASLERIGKVFATVVNKLPGQHNTSAAKVVFWDRTGVNNLLGNSARGEFVFPGQSTIQSNGRVKSNQDKRPTLLAICNSAAVIYCTF